MLRLLIPSAKEQLRYLSNIQRALPKKIYSDVQGPPGTAEREVTRSNYALVPRRQALSSGLPTSRRRKNPCRVAGLHLIQNEPTKSACDTHGHPRVVAEANGHGYNAHEGRFRTCTFSLPKAVDNIAPPFRLAQCRRRHKAKGRSVGRRLPQPGH